MSGMRSLTPQKTKVQTTSLASSSGKKSSILLDSEDGITLSSIPAHVHLQFPTHIEGASHIAMTFQGGFAPTSAMVYVATKHKEGSADVDLGLIMGSRIHIEDTSKRQVFKIPYPGNVMVPKYPPTSLPTALTSQESLGPSITTEVPPNPSGGGEPAKPSAPNGNGDGDAAWGVPEITELKIEFEGTSDNQGRITLYQIEVLG